ncbi:Sphingomyelin phosphodiesterase D LarSicTox-alphaIII1 [Gossypium arboreum]|uniref:Sphingomyelin phosphodiesterase D LarSicTox-alphaIII1 n=1 Tax=Gossypium arboreum TaxID=29729 RepID=A0A0B0P214_GOSAR|nr:Sphingomyelin phosphodiesterase D LarSicTox-alphaIII1 [Gossypium arboreum]
MLGYYKEAIDVVKGVCERFQVQAFHLTNSGLEFEYLRGFWSVRGSFKHRIVTGVYSDCTENEFQRKPKSTLSKPHGRVVARVVGHMSVHGSVVDDQAVRMQDGRDKHSHVKAGRPCARHRLGQLGRVGHTDVMPVLYDTLHWGGFDKVKEELKGFISPDGWVDLIPTWCVGLDRVILNSRRIGAVEDSMVTTTTHVLVYELSTIAYSLFLRILM